MFKKESIWFRIDRWVDKCKNVQPFGKNQLICHNGQVKISF